MKTPWLRKDGSTSRTWSGEIVPQGLVYPVARYEGITGHFNSTGALVTGCRQDVDAYGSEAPVTPTIFELFPEGTRAPARRGMGHCDEQELRPHGRQQAPRVRRSLLRQRRAPETAPDRDDQVRRQHERRARRRRSTGACRAHDVWHSTKATKGSAGRCSSRAGRSAPG